MPFKLARTVGSRGARAQRLYNTELVLKGGNNLPVIWEALTRAYGAVIIALYSFTVRAAG